MLAAVGDVLADDSDGGCDGGGGGGSVAGSFEMAAAATDSTFADRAIVSSPIVCRLANVTRRTTIRASSQTNLVSCLGDGTSETFWESGDEASNRNCWMLAHMIVRL